MAEDYQELPENVGLIYSGLLQPCRQAASGGRGIRFVHKRNKGQTYWQRPRSLIGWGYPAALARKREDV